MANTKDNAAAKETKRRLIDAAGSVFAEHGYERATIKEITSRAGASMAAVNYHFSDKAELYYQVIRHAHETASGAIEGLKHLPADMPPRARLSFFITTLLADLLDPAVPKWKANLIWREMQEPTDATVRLLAETFRECSDNLEGLVRSLLPRKVSPARLRLIVQSILGQCLFHVNHRELHALMFPDEPPASARVAEIARHITTFSLAAIETLFTRAAKPASR